MQKTTPLSQTKSRVLSNLETIRPGGNYLYLINRGVSDTSTVREQYTGFSPIIITSEHQTNLSPNTVVLGGEYSQREFLTKVGRDHYIRALTETILRNQEELDVVVTAAKEGYPFSDVPGIRLIGPTPEMCNLFNNKFRQREIFEGKMPMLKGKRIPKKELEKSFNEFDQGYGVFVQKEKGYAGNGSERIENEDQLREFLEKPNGFDEITITGWKGNVIVSPSVMGIVANEDEILVLPVIDQLLEGFSCSGSRYPSVLEQYDIDELAGYTVEIGRIMAGYGYKGFFGVDFIVDEHQNKFLIEINARHCGSTGVVANLMSLSQPHNSPSVLDLEYLAVTQSTFGRYRLWEPPQGIFWQMQKCKSKGASVVQKEFEGVSEQETFRRMSAGLFNTLPLDTIIERNQGFGKIISVGHSREDVDQKHQSLVKLLAESVRPLPLSNLVGAQK